MRTKERGINLNNLTIINAEKAAPSRRRVPYQKILSKIPKAKALVITDEEFNIGTLRTGICRLQKKGKFTNLKITQRTENGIRKLYIINRIF